MYIRNCFKTMLKISRVGNTYTKDLYTDTINIEPTSTALKWNHHAVTANIRLYSNSNYLRKLKANDTLDTVTSYNSFTLGVDTNKWTYVIHENCSTLSVGITGDNVNHNLDIIALEEDIILFNLSLTHITITQTRNKRFTIASTTFEITSYTNEIIKPFIASKLAFSAEINYDQKATIQIKDNKTQFSSNVPIIFSSSYFAQTTYVTEGEDYNITDQDYFIIIRNSIVKKLYLPSVKLNKGRILIIYREYAAITNEDPLDPELKIFPINDDTIDSLTEMGLPEKGVATMIADGLSTWVVH